ncbi:MAG: hypothetical protein SGARI_000167 [Bacillariaceae sp.]
MYGKDEDLPDDSSSLTMFHWSPKKGTLNTGVSLNDAIKEGIECTRTNLFSNGVNTELHNFAAFTEALLKKQFPSMQKAADKAEVTEKNKNARKMDRCYRTRGATESGDVSSTVATPGLEIPVVVPLMTCLYGLLKTNKPRHQDMHVDSSKIATYAYNLWNKDELQENPWKVGYNLLYGGFFLRDTTVQLEKVDYVDGQWENRISAPTQGKCQATFLQDEAVSFSGPKGIALTSYRTQFEENSEYNPEYRWNIYPRFLGNAIESKKSSKSPT